MSSGDKVDCSDLETLPGEPVDLLVGLGAGVPDVLTVLDEGILVHLVEGNVKSLGLVVAVGESEPLVEGHGAVAVLIDGGELVLAAPGPELAAELLGEGGGSADHSLELALVHLAVKVLVSGDKSPKC